MAVIKQRAATSANCVCPGCTWLSFLAFCCICPLIRFSVIHSFADIAGMEVSVDARSRDDGRCPGERSRNTQNVSSISFTFHVLNTD